MQNFKINQKIILILFFVVFASGCLGFIGSGDPVTEDPQNYEIEKIVEGLENPWSIEFIENTALILATEKSGELAIINETEGSKNYLENIPEVDHSGQGGLLDITTHENFSKNNKIFLTYTDDNEEGIATHLGKATLNIEDQTLEDFETIHVAEPFVEGGLHFGSRLIMDEGYVYFTVGDRGDKDFGPNHHSQNTSNELGTTLRVDEEGNIPETNPFIQNDSIKDSIYAYGQRNSQGMTINPETQEIWQSEHGEQDGDEINILEKGGNYGWPITHYGCTYATGSEIGEQPHEREDVVNPVYYWECNTGGFPPAGMTFYYGEYEEWQGNLFIGNLAGQFLGQFQVEHTENNVNVENKASLLTDQDWRIRDVENKGNYLYAIVDDESAPLIKIKPEMENQ